MVGRRGRLESSEQRSTRLERDRQRHAMRRAKESDDQRAWRLQQDRQRQAASRQKLLALEAEGGSRSTGRAASRDGKTEQKRKELVECDHLHVTEPQRAEVVMGKQQCQRLKRKRQQVNSLHETQTDEHRSKKLEHKRLYTAPHKPHKHQGDRSSESSSNEQNDYDMNNELTDNEQFVVKTEPFDSDSTQQLEELDNLSNVKSEQLDNDLGNSQVTDSDETPDSPPATIGRSKLNFLLQKLREKRRQEIKAAGNDKKLQRHELPTAAATSSQQTKPRPTPPPPTPRTVPSPPLPTPHPAVAASNCSQSTVIESLTRSPLSSDVEHINETNNCDESTDDLETDEIERAMEVAAESSSAPSRTTETQPGKTVVAPDNVRSVRQRATRAEQKHKTRAKRFNTMSAEEKQRYRANQAERVRQQRALMSPEQREKLRAADAERTRQRRAKLRAEMLATLSTDESRRQSIGREKVRVRRVAKRGLETSTDNHQQQQHLGNELHSSGNFGSVQIMRVKDLRLTVVHDINSASLLAHEGKHVYMRSSQEPKPYRCPYCSERFNSYVGREQHIRSHPDRLPLSSTRARCGATEHQQICFFCNVVFSNLDDFLHHISDSHSDVGWQLYICGICQRACDQRFKFQKHQGIYHSDTSALHLCELCGASFRLQKSLHRHALLHSGRQPYQCEQCGKRFAFKKGYRDHMDMHAAKAGDDRFKCDVCGKVLSTHDSLKKHVRTHMEKPYHCQMCDKAFAFSYHLRLHIGSAHRTLDMNPKLKSRPYTCGQCGKSFVSPSYRKIHERIHAGEKPFSCVDCGRTFVTKINMTLHTLRIHNEAEKQHVCQYCSKSFALKFDLSRHLLRHNSSK